jgi:hypothetical protein
LRAYGQPLLPRKTSARDAQGKRKRGARQAQAAFGYILTKVDFQSFPRYEYVSRTSLGEMTGEILIERSLELVNLSGQGGMIPGSFFLSGLRSTLAYICR